MYDSFRATAATDSNPMAKFYPLAQTGYLGLQRMGDQRGDQKDDQCFPSMAIPAPALMSPAGTICNQSQHSPDRYRSTRPGTIDIFAWPQSLGLAGGLREVCKPLGCSERVHSRWALLRREYALACAYVIPERIHGVGVISGMGPWQGFKTGDGMPWQRHLSWRFCKYGGDAAVQVIFKALLRTKRRVLAGNFTATGEVRDLDLAHIQVRAFVKKLRKDLDKDHPSVKECTESKLIAFIHGAAGFAHESRLNTRPWGFRISRPRARNFPWKSRHQLPSMECRISGGEAAREQARSVHR